MAKNAYLVISDLHVWDHNLANRFDYRKEVDYALREVTRIAEKYQRLGYTITALYGGDVFHRGYKSIDNALKDSSFFHLWNKRFGEQFVCVGNHELTYAKNNPFHSLVKDLNSDRLKGRIQKPLAVKGLYPVFRVQDRLEDGEVVFHFNHYGTGIAVPEPGKVNVAIVHQDVCEGSIVQEMRSVYGEGFVVGEHYKGFHTLAGYQYSFLCHMHKVLGVWGTANGGTIAALGSLGRTNVSEVNDKKLTRIVPVVTVVDGHSEGAEAEEFDLTPFDECVDRAALQKAREAYQTVKVKREAKVYRPVLDDPMQDLDTALGDNELARAITREILGHSNTLDSQLQRRVQEVLR